MILIAKINVFVNINKDRVAEKDFVFDKCTPMTYSFNSYNYVA